MHRNRTLVLLVAAALGLLVPACAQIDPFPPETFNPTTDSGSADFSVLVGVGNSLTAGYTNGGLLFTHQVMSYSAQVAAQLGKEIVYSGATQPQPGVFVLPGVGSPGTPGYMYLVSLEPDSIYVVPPPLSPQALLNPGYLAPYNDLGVPGADAEDFFTATSGGAFDIVLRGQGTMYQQTAALQPTFVLLWLGNNDVLKKVTSDEDITPPVQFALTFSTIVDSLLHLPSQPKLAVGNIFSVSSIPYASTVPPFRVNPSTGQPVLSPGGNLVPLLGPNEVPLTLPSASGPGDLVMVTAIPLLEQGIGVPAAYGGTGVGLPKVIQGRTVLLYQDEVVEINNAVDAYNEAILAVAVPRGIPVADANSILQEATETGLDIGGVTYTTEFITGGLVGLDGIHPTDLGYAILANAFIEAINGAYGSAIPRVDLHSYIDPTTSTSTRSTGLVRALP
jgi:hypothetical protein